MQFKVNVNEQVKVKLTEFGMSILKNRRDELNRQLKANGGKGLSEFELKTDENGYTTFQLWDLMNTFGEVLTIGFKIPFETEIIITNIERV